MKKPKYIVKYRRIFEKPGTDKEFCLSVSRLLSSWVYLPPIKDCSLACEIAHTLHRSFPGADGVKIFVDTGGVGYEITVDNPAKEGYEALIEDATDTVKINDPT